jgi:hypothetical protein
MARTSQQYMHDLLKEGRESWHRIAYRRMYEELPAALAAVEHLKERLAKAEAERNTLAGHLQDIYAHPASTPPILALAAGALRAFGFTVPPRWRLDH